MKKVYTCFCTDIVHEGHLNIISESKKLGELTIGVLCDSEMIRYNRFPLKTLEERMDMLREIPEVDNVIVQNTIMYDEIVERLHPDYIVHGNNWTDPGMAIIKENILGLMEKYGGELVEIPYTFNEKIQKIDRQMIEKLSMPEFRRGRLRKLLAMVPIIKTIEVHSGLTGLIAEKTIVAKGEEIDQFDAMWISSLCDSTAKGKPDIELVDMTSRFRTIDDVMEVTTKPIIFDGDTGGLTEHFVYTVRSLERMGEDKTGLKKNSLFGTEVDQMHDSIEHFRELFEICEANGQGHQYDFLTVGSMGHSSSVALGVALHKPDKKIWCIDGDGAVLMHMGVMAIIGVNKPKNLVHIVINNSAHETVGGMPTVVGQIDLMGVAQACGYKKVLRADNYDSLDLVLNMAKNCDETTFIDIPCAISARNNLGRPTSKPVENKEQFIKQLSEV